MEFKVGDKVRIVKNLGPFKRLDAKSYYYSGSIEKVLLNSLGVIEEISDDGKKIYVRLENGKNWWLHPAEIELVAKKNLKVEELLEGLKVNDTIPESFFSYFSRKSPFALIEDRIYLVGSKRYDVKSTSIDDFLQDAKLRSRALFILKERDYIVAELEKGPTLEDAEKFYFELHDRMLNKICKNIERGLTERMGNLEDLILRYTPNKEIIDLVLFKILPHFIQRNEEMIDELLQKKTKNELTEKEILDYLERNTRNVRSVEHLSIRGLEELKEIIRELETETPDFYKRLRAKLINSAATSTEKGRSIEELVDSYYGKKKIEKKEELTLCSFDNKIYRLSRGSLPQTDWTFSLFIDGELYNKGPSIEPDLLEELFQQHVTEKLQKRIIQQYKQKLADLEEELLKSRKVLINFYTGDLKNIEIGNFGAIFENSNTATLYLKVPKYALKNPKDGCYYTFGKCSVAIKVYYKNNYDITRSSAFVIEEYSHPFLKDYNKAHQEICMGNFSFRYGLTETEKIVELLLTAKKVIMSGYTSKINPHHFLEKEFQSHKTDKSREKLEKEGYVILNEEFIKH